MSLNFFKQSCVSANSSVLSCIRLSLLRYYSKLGPIDLKGRKTAAQKWLTRQCSDPYVKLARKENYRCRSAFKLIEIDEKFDILQPGHVVVDCGAAPGSWSQVAVDRVNSLGTEPDRKRGTVISVDLQHMLPIDGATVIDNSDITSAQVQERIVELVAGRAVDVVLSDMAPSATGVRALDQDQIIRLAMSVLRLAASILKESVPTNNTSAGKGGTLLVKLWQGRETDNLMHTMQKCFRDVRIVKPLASRSDSAEIFVLARNFSLSQPEDKRTKFT